MTGLPAIAAFHRVQLAGASSDTRVRLFRQPVQGDGGSVVQKVVEELEHWLVSRRECQAEV